MERQYAHGTRGVMSSTSLDFLLDGETEVLASSCEVLSILPQYDQLDRISVGNQIYVVRKKKDWTVTRWMAQRVGIRMAVSSGCF